MSGAEPAVIAAIAAEAAPAAATAVSAAAAGSAAAGTAGILGSGMYGIPLAESAGSLIGAGGSVGSGLLGGTEAAGALGSGMAGFGLPGAAETSPAWGQAALNAAQTGGKAMQTYSTVNGAMGGNKQAPAAHASPMPFQGQAAQQISPYSGQQSTGNQFADSLRRKMINNSGLLE